MTLKACYINGTYHGENMPRPFTHLGEGVFETMRVYRQSASRTSFIIGFERHLLRLREGMRVIECAKFDTSELRAALSSIIISTPWTEDGDLKLRIVVLKNDFIVSMEPFASGLQTAWSKGEGISAVTMRAERALPEIKSCSALVSVRARHYAEKEGADEALLIDRDDILREGAWSNFFWVTKTRELKSPKTLMLPGVTRAIVAELAAPLCPVQFTDAPFDSVQEEAAECFATLATHGVVPITRIDGRPVGRGGAGSVTLQLRQAYQNALSDDRLVSRFQTR